MTAPIRESTDKPRASARASRAKPRSVAFRKLHGRRLHGFALLLTLGDQPAAARVALEALAAGFLRSDPGDPGSSAAWLRQEVLRQVSHGPRGAAPSGGQATLKRLGVDAAAFAGLSALGIRERAALVAASVERLDEADVAAIIGEDGARLERFVRRARRRATEVGSNIPVDRSSDEGPIVAGIKAIAARTMT